MSVPQWEYDAVLAENRRLLQENREMADRLHTLETKRLEARTRLAVMVEDIRARRAEP